MRRLDIRVFLIVSVFVVAMVVVTTYALASATNTFSQTVNAGTLTTDIRDSVKASVGSPGVTMGAKTFSFDCANCAKISMESGILVETVYLHLQS